MNALQETGRIIPTASLVEENQEKPALAIADSCAASNEYVLANQKSKMKRVDKKPGITGVKMKENQKFATMLQNRMIETSLSKASNFVGYGDIDIASNNNLNVLGSMLSSVNGNVTLAAANDIKIEAGTNTLSQKSKQETIYGGGSVGNNGVQLNIGLSQGESDYSKTFYTNSQISAENGTLTLNTGNDANISGANLLAKNVALNIGNNLNVSSKQTEEDFSSSGYGFNFGVGVGSGGNGGNVGGGFNMSNADMHRLWVDDITTIKGTDSLAINTGIKAGSTGDLNLTGAAILSDNLALAVSGATNKKDLQDSYYSESMSFGLSRSIPVGSGSQATVTGTGGKPNSFPGGSTTISGSYAQNESSRTVYATIGGLDSTLTSATKDVTGGEFEGSLTIDHRLFSESGRTDIENNLKLSSDVWFGTNLLRPKTTESGTASKDAVPGTLVWASRWIDERNDQIDPETGKPKPSPAPNIWIGFGGQPNTGLQSESCANSLWCNPLFSERGILRVPHDAIPGFRSSSSFHDAGKYPEWSTQATIPPYFLFNYYGSIGTILDVPNWNKNFANSETNIFKGTIVNKPEIFGNKGD